MNITLHQHYGFKTTADVGTFTAAAHRLKIAQPALSLNIRDLEKELGARLSTGCGADTVGGMTRRDR